MPATRPLYALFILKKTFTLSPTSRFLLIFIRKECEWFVFQVFTTHRWLREKGVKG